MSGYTNLLGMHQNLWVLEMLGHLVGVGHHAIVLQYFKMGGGMEMAI